MLKKDLIDRIAFVGLTKKQAGATLDATLEAIADSLKDGDPILLTGFGKFEVRTRAARTGINPKTLASAWNLLSQYRALATRKLRTSLRPKLNT